MKMIVKFPKDCKIILPIEMKLAKLYI